jgi:hypothetical protein
MIEFVQPFLCELPGVPLPLQDLALSVKHPLLVQACIDARDFAIDEKAAFQAILRKYPAEEAAPMIDLTGTAVPTNAEGFFPVAARTIAEKTRDILRPRADGRRKKHLSVFALAPIPLLVHFGHLLGDIEHVDLYQRHRGEQGWTWEEEEADEEFYEIVAPMVADDSRKPIALLLSVSGQIDHDMATAVLGPDARIHEIRAITPGLDCLPSRKRLEMFGYEARKLLTQLREVYRQDRDVHVFAADPAPVAIKIGRSIRAYDPAFVIYEHRKGNRSYFPALTVNSQPEPLLSSANQCPLKVGVFFQHVERKIAGRTPRWKDVVDMTLVTRTRATAGKTRVASVFLFISKLLSS